GELFDDVIYPGMERARPEDGGPHGSAGLLSYERVATDEQRLDVSETLHVGVEVHPSVLVNDLVAKDIGLLGRRRRGHVRGLVPQSRSVLVGPDAMVPTRVTSQPSLHPLALVRGQGGVPDPDPVEELRDRSGL